MAIIYLGYKILGPSPSASSDPVLVVVFPIPKDPYSYLFALS